MTQTTCSRRYENCFSAVQAKPLDRQRASHASSTHQGRRRIVDSARHSLLPVTRRADDAWLPGCLASTLPIDLVRTALLRTGLMNEKSKSGNGFVSRIRKRPYGGVRALVFFSIGRNPTSSPETARPSRTTTYSSISSLPL